MHKHAYAKHTEINCICSKLMVNKHKAERKERENMYCQHKIMLGSESDMFMCFYRI